MANRREGIEFIAGAVLMFGAGSTNPAGVVQTPGLSVLPPAKAVIDGAILVRFV